MINVVNTMIATRVVLGEGINGAGHRHPTHTLMTVDPAAVTNHAVDVLAGVHPLHQVVADPAPLWGAVVRAMRDRGMGRIALAVPACSNEPDMGG